MDTHRQGSRLRYGAIAPGIVISLAFGLGACTISAPPSATQREAASSQPDRATARPTADAIGGADDAVLGRWRRAPAHVSDPVERAAEAACRAENAVGALPRVVVDARGEGQVTLVFATAKVAAVCHATVTASGDASADARVFEGDAATTPDPKRLGAHDLEVIQSSTGARTVLVGRVGADVARVSAQFDDGTWSDATMAGGWYAMWWPGPDPALTVAAVDNRSEALDGFAP